MARHQLPGDRFGRDPELILQMGLEGLVLPQRLGPSAGRRKTANQDPVRGLAKVVLRQRLAGEVESRLRPIGRQCRFRRCEHCGDRLFPDAPPLLGQPGLESFLLRGETGKQVAKVKPTGRLDLAGLLCCRAGLELADVARDQLPVERHLRIVGDDNLAAQEFPKTVERLAQALAALRFETRGPEQLPQGLAPMNLGVGDGQVGQERAFLCARYDDLAVGLEPVWRLRRSGALGFV
jgi:hypothetical protein